MKKWILGLVVLFFVLVCLTYFMREMIALEVYKFRHNGLINYDYGILSKKDLVKAEEGYFPPVPFDGRQGSYPYWQCFNKKYLKVGCGSYNEPLDQLGSSFGIDVATESEVHSYSLPHAISGEICKELVERINGVSKNENYFCINGWSGALDRVGEKKEFSWTFENFKTRAGYVNLSEGWE